MPLPMVALPWGSRSTSSTRWPASARAAARVTLGIQRRHLEFNALLHRPAGRQRDDFLPRIPAFHGVEATFGARQVPGQAHEVGQVGEGAGNDTVEGPLRTELLHAAAAGLEVGEAQFDLRLLLEAGLLAHREGGTGCVRSATCSLMLCRNG